MSWKTLKNEPSGASEQPPEGNHPAVLVAIVNLGHQDVTYQGESKVVHELYFCWELCHKTRSNGERHLVKKTVTASLHEKANLAKLLKGWFGKAVPPGASLDLPKLLGKAGLVNVGRDDSGKYAVLNGVGPLPDGTAAPPPQRTPVITGVGEDAEVPDWLPWIYKESVADYCAHSHEMGGRTTAAPAQNGKAAQAAPVTADANGSDDTPF